MSFAPGTILKAVIHKEDGTIKYYMFQAGLSSSSKTMPLGGSVIVLDSSIITSYKIDYEPPTCFLHRRNEVHICEGAELRRYKDFSLV